MARLEAISHAHPGPPTPFSLSGACLARLEGGSPYHVQRTPTPSPPHRPGRARRRCVFDRPGNATRPLYLLTSSSPVSAHIHGDRGRCVFDRPGRAARDASRHANPPSPPLPQAGKQHSPKAQTGSDSKWSPRKAPPSSSTISSRCALGPPGNAFRVWGVPHIQARQPLSRSPISSRCAFGPPGNTPLPLYLLTSRHTNPFMDGFLRCVGPPGNAHASPTRQPYSPWDDPSPTRAGGIDVVLVRITRFFL